ncbi:MAG: alpha/beta hydrolase [Chloroflexota bacterium]|nr:alpha/beta hydrolase [Chloroflexota bacterium]
MTPIPDVLPVHEHGSGPPLLLLHGLGMSGGAFGLMAPLLGETFRLIMPDLRGHGRSSHLPGPRTTDTMAADLVPTLDALGIDAIHVLGHSHGGAVAQAFARAHPERVRSLLLVSTYPVQLLTWWQRMLGEPAPLTVTLFGTQPAAGMVRWLHSAGGGRRMSPQAAALCATLVAANDRHCLADVLTWARQFDSRSWLGALRVPTLVIQGDADYVVVPRQAQMLADDIPGARLQLLKGAGHALPFSHPIELADLVEAWLDERERGAVAERRVPAVA